MTAKAINKIIPSAVLAMLAVLLTTPATMAQTAPSPKTAKTAALKAGDKIGTLPVMTEDGQEIDLVTATKGWKVVYLWSPTCPCVRSCQSLSLFPLWHQYQASGIAFYAIASNAGDVIVRRLRDGKERAFLSLPGGAGQVTPYPTVIDTHHRVADALGAVKTPQTYLISPDNQIVWMGNPDDSEEIREKTGRSGEKTKDYLAVALREALAGNRLMVTSTPVLGCTIDRSDFLVTEVTKADKP